LRIFNREPTEEDAHGIFLLFFLPNEQMRKRHEDAEMAAKAVPTPSSAFEAHKVVAADRTSPA